MPSALASLIGAKNKGLSAFAEEALYKRKQATCWVDPK